MKPSLDIIIVNWNAGRQLRDCLESIVTSKKNSFILNQIVVIDNASTDDSARNLEDINLPLKVIFNSKNIGFGAACNQGAKETKADYLLFLNPDTRLFPDSLCQPITFMETIEANNIGICGIQMIDTQAKIHRHCSRFPTFKNFFARITGLSHMFPQIFPQYVMTDWDHSSSRKVDHVIGAFFLVREKLFKQLHGFDENFFVYYEDLDFSYRAALAGWNSYYLAQVQAFHKSNGTTDQIKATRLFYSLRSRIQYVYKHFSFVQATLISLLMLTIEPVSRIALATMRGSITQTKETITAYYLYWRFLFNYPKTIK